MRKKRKWEEEEEEVRGRLDNVSLQEKLPPHLVGRRERREDDADDEDFFIAACIHIEGKKKERSTHARYKKYISWSERKENDDNDDDVVAVDVIETHVNDDDD